jgi:hypothetical protein
MRFGIDSLHCTALPFEKLVDWTRCAAVMKREVVAVIPSCSGGSNPIFIPLTVVRI